MIDKELIRKAAEDIDLFGDDLSAEFDRLSQTRTRSIRLWPYVAAACIALLLAVGVTVRLLTSNPNDTGSLAQAPPNPRGGERRRGATNKSYSPSGDGGA